MAILKPCLTVGASNNFALHRNGQVFVFQTCLAHKNTTKGNKPALSIKPSTKLKKTGPSNFLNPISQSTKMECKFVTSFISKTSQGGLAKFFKLNTATQVRTW